MRHRIDFILASPPLRAAATRCLVDYDVDMSTAIRDDHFVLIADLSDVCVVLGRLADQHQLCKDYAKPLLPRPPKYAEASLTDPASKLYFERLISSVDFDFAPCPTSLMLLTLKPAAMILTSGQVSCLPASCGLPSRPSSPRKLKSASLGCPTRPSSLFGRLRLRGSGYASFEIRVVVRSCLQSFIYSSPEPL